MENEKAFNFMAGISKLEQMAFELKQKSIQLNSAADSFLYEMQYMKADILDEDALFSEEDKHCYVYYILNAEKSMVKIGVSNNVGARIAHMQTSTGYDLELLHKIEFPSRAEAFEAERALHYKFSYFRKKPSKIHKSSEWFSADIVPILMKQYLTADAVNAEVERQNQAQRDCVQIIENVFYGDSA